MPSLAIYERDKIKYLDYKLNNEEALMNPKLINVEL